MRLEAAGPSTGARRRRTAALAALSAAIHLALLVPLALTTARLAPRGTSEMTVTVIPVEFSRRPGARPSVDRRRAPDRRLREGGDRPAAGARPLARPAGDAPAPRRGPAAAGPAPVVDEAWRVRPGPGRPARLPCPAPPGDRLGQRLCAVGPTPDHDPPPLTRADLLPLEDGRSRERREEGFARQVEANEAWRAYTREGGAYPGLRSLFSER